jgi:hypothetical protein
MPVASTLQELIDAIQTKKTNTMRALDDLFGSQAALTCVNNHTHRAELNSPNVFESGPNSELPPWAVDELQGSGECTVTHPLSHKEIDHINQWSAADKEELRAVLVAALEARPPAPIGFFWELHDGKKEEIDTRTPGRVTFRSPKRRARVSGSAIEVEVRR